MYYDKVIRSLLLSMVLITLLILGGWAAVKSSQIVEARAQAEFAVFLLEEK